MREIKTVALIGLGAIGSFLASHFKYALNTVICVSSREASAKNGWRKTVLSSMGNLCISMWYPRRRKWSLPIW